MKFYDIKKGSKIILERSDIGIIYEVPVTFARRNTKKSCITIKGKLQEENLDFTLDSIDQDCELLESEEIGGHTYNVFPSFFKYFLLLKNGKYIKKYRSMIDIKASDKFWIFKKKDLEVTEVEVERIVTDTYGTLNTMVYTYNGSKYEFTFSELALYKSYTSGPTEETLKVFDKGVLKKLISRAVKEFSGKPEDLLEVSKKCIKLFE